MFELTHQMIATAAQVATAALKVSDVYAKRSGHNFLFLLAEAGWTELMPDNTAQVFEHVQYPDVRVLVRYDRTYVQAYTHTPEYVQCTIPLA